MTPKAFFGLVLFLWLTACDERRPPDISRAPLDAAETLIDSEDLFRQFGGDVRRLAACARKQQKTIVVAHRGGMAPGYPENAIETIERTIQSIPAIIEIDIASSSDGVDFLHHDGAMERTTSGVGAANSLTWNELSRLSLFDNDLVETDYKPITLQAALERLQGRGFLMLDLKSPSDTSKVVQMVEKANSLDASIFIAYNFDQARQIISTAPTALVALGANSLHQVNETKEAGFFDSPYVALTGALGHESEIRNALKNAGHYMLAGSYLGVNPPDARLALNTNLEVLNLAPKMGVQFIVSNRAVQLHNYLSARGLLVEPSSCG